MNDWKSSDGNSLADSDSEQLSVGRKRKINNRRRNRPLARLLTKMAKMVDGHLQQLDLRRVVNFGVLQLLDSAIY